MRLGIFSHAAGAYGPRRFKEEAIKLGLEAESYSYGQLDFAITDGGVEVLLSGKNIPSFDMAIFRSAGGNAYFVPQRNCLLSFFEGNGVAVLNKETYKKWDRLDKFTQHLEFVKSGLPFVDTYLCGQEERLQKQIFFPSVVKVYFGSQGKKVFKVENKNQLGEILNQYKAGNLIFEPVLPEGEDVRVIVLAGKAIGAMKRIAQKGQFLTNYSQGGSVENFPLDQATADLAQKAAKAFLLEYVGVDLMKDEKGNWRILEVNRACQFEGFEKATGINVAQLVVEYLLKKKKGGTE